LNLATLTAQSRPLIQDVVFGGAGCAMLMLFIKVGFSC
jgi:hypothetical protein